MGNFLEVLESTLNDIPNAKRFNNWVRPDNNVIAREYHVEYSLKDLGYYLGDPWKTASEFVKAVKAGKIVSISQSDDNKISNRSQTKNRAQLTRLLQSYRSWPEFRNEKTLQELYDGFAENRKMELPIVLQLRDGSRRIFSGNTRLDVAFQTGAPAKVIIVQVP